MKGCKFVKSPCPIYHHFYLPFCSGSPFFVVAWFPMIEKCGRLYYPGSNIAYILLKSQKSYNFSTSETKSCVTLKQTASLNFYYDNRDPKGNIFHSISINNTSVDGKLLIMHLFECQLDLTHRSISPNFDHQWTNCHCALTILYEIPTPNSIWLRNIMGWISWSHDFLYNQVQTKTRGFTCQIWQITKSYKNTIYIVKDRLPQAIKR